MVNPRDKAGNATEEEDQLLEYQFLIHVSDICRLVGLVVKVSASRAEDSGFDSRLRRGDFSGSSHTKDFKIDTPVATLPGIIGSALGLVGRCQYTVTG